MIPIETIKAGGQPLKDMLLELFNMRGTPGQYHRNGTDPQSAQSSKTREIHWNVKTTGEFH